jgi:hypothetical protein
MRRTWALASAGILLLTASAVWSLRDLPASALALPVAAAPGIGAPPPPERIVLRYEGDLRDFAHSSIVYSRLQPATRVPFLALANASDFSARIVGLAVSTAEFPRDFDAVMRDPLATEAFGELASDGAPAGRIYGLCGLSRTDVRQFLRSRAAAAQDARRVRLFVGCFVHEESLGEVARRMTVGCPDLGI